jgi:hypothetical protein
MVAVMLVLGLAQVSLSPAHAVAPASPAAAVTAFVQDAVAPRVLALEGTLAVARHQVDAYAAGQTRADTLLAVLGQQSLALRGLSQDLAALTPPWLGLLPTLQMARALEDLAACGEQLAGLLQDATGAGASPPRFEGGDLAMVEYGPRLHAALALASRAEAWLRTIDRETGARVRLPGCDGGRALETPSAENICAPPGQARTNGASRGLRLACASPRRFQAPLGGRVDLRHRGALPDGVGRCYTATSEATSQPGRREGRPASCLRRGW